MARKTLTTRRYKHLTIELPPEFVALCKQDNVAPEVVLRGFIADLCELTSWVNDPRADATATTAAMNAATRWSITNGWATRG